MSFNRAGIVSMRSVATRERCPFLEAAKSPAHPCKYTAALAESVRLSPWQINPPSMPVRTSPVPPDAMPGFPVGLTKTSPDGVETMVRAPLRTTWQRKSAANCLAVPIRSSWISLEVFPTRRAISPGWGVRMTGALASRRTCLAAASAVRPSASMTMGIGRDRTSL